MPGKYENQDIIKNRRTAWSTINDKVEKVGERGEFVESKELNPTVFVVSRQSICAGCKIFMQVHTCSALNLIISSF